MDIDKKESINGPHSSDGRPHGIVYALPRDWRPPDSWCRVGIILGEEVDGELDIDQTASVPEGYDIAFRFFDEMIRE
jgi:hypothetical protein